MTQMNEIILGYEHPAKVKVDDTDQTIRPNEWDEKEVVKMDETILEKRYQDELVVVDVDEMMRSN